MNRVGISGWDSAGLYEAGIRSQDKLRLYSDIYDTVEINSTFYGFPSQETVENWYLTVPETFRFSVKLNRMFSHDQPLVINGETVRNLNQFLASTALLKEKLSWYLLQLPPGLAADAEALNSYLAFLRDSMQAHRIQADLAVEFRHPTWYADWSRKALHSFGAVQVISSSPGKWPLVWVKQPKANYIRLHGLHKMYHSFYSHEELRSMTEWLSQTSGTDAWIYFDNGATPAAKENSLYLKKLFGQPVPEEATQLRMDLW